MEVECGLIVLLIVGVCFIPLVSFSTVLGIVLVYRNFLWNLKAFLFVGSPTAQLATTAHSLQSGAVQI